jgi:hypothetical protein
MKLLLGRQECMQNFDGETFWKDALEISSRRRENGIKSDLNDVRETSV